MNPHHDPPMDLGGANVAASRSSYPHPPNDSSLRIALVSQ